MKNYIKYLKQDLESAKKDKGLFTHYKFLIGKLYQSVRTYHKLEAKIEQKIKDGKDCAEDVKMLNLAREDIQYLIKFSENYNSSISTVCPEIASEDEDYAEEILLSKIKESIKAQNDGKLDDLKSAIKKSLNKSAVATG